METKIQISCNSVEKFWFFFLQIASDILLRPEDAFIINNIDYQIKELGPFDWEYGPNETGGFYFCISPSLNKDLIKTICFIISFAPQINGWTFRCGKPPKKELIDEFEVMNEDGSFRTIRTNKWYVIAYKFKDGTYDIDIKTDLTDNENTQYTLIDIHLTNLLGEMRYIDKIKNVCIVKEFDSSHSNPNGFSVNYLDEIIK